MANAVLSNKIYVDSTGSVREDRTIISMIIFSPDAANDQLVLRETSSGSDVLKLQSATAKQTQVFDFSSCPLVFQNGVYIQTITSGAKATLITTSGAK